MKIIIIINKNRQNLSLFQHSAHFFKRWVWEAVVAAVSIVELNLFQILGPRNDILFCPLIVPKSGIFDAICNLVL